MADEDRCDFRLRVPRKMHNGLGRAAMDNGRSINAEILARLHQPEAMSLRDWFAGHALSIAAGRSWSHLPDDAAIVRAWASMAYSVADAMLAARAQAAEAPNA